MLFFGKRQNPVRFVGFGAVYPHNSGVLGTLRCDERCYFGVAWMLIVHTDTWGMFAPDLLPTNWQQQTQ